MSGKINLWDKQSSLFSSFADSSGLTRQLHSFNILCWDTAQANSCPWQLLPKKEWTDQNAPCRSGAQTDTYAAPNSPSPGWESWDKGPVVSPLFSGLCGCWAPGREQRQELCYLSAGKYQHQLFSPSLRLLSEETEAHSSENHHACRTWRRGSAVRDLPAALLSAIQFCGILIVVLKTLQGPSSATIRSEQFPSTGSETIPKGGNMGRGRWFLVSRHKRTGAAGMSDSHSTYVHHVVAPRDKLVPSVSSTNSPFNMLEQSYTPKPLLASPQLNPTSLSHKGCH